jgi:hypothetical protein
MAADPLVKLTMRPTAGQYTINGVVLGTWRQTAPDVVHVESFGMRGKQCASFEEADAAAREALRTWFAGLLGPGADA